MIRAGSAVVAHESIRDAISGEASLMRVIMLFRYERRRCESDAHGGGGSGGTPPENFEI